VIVAVDVLVHDVLDVVADATRAARLCIGGVAAYHRESDGATKYEGISSPLAASGFYRTLLGANLRAASQSKRLVRQS
jgi:hypothetical protein